MNGLERLLEPFARAREAAVGELAERTVRAILQQGAALDQVTRTLDQLRVVAVRQAEAAEENTAALKENTAMRSGSALGFAGDALRIAGRFAGGGLGLSPVIAGLIGLFARGESEPPRTAPRYVPPAALRFEGATRGPAGSSLVAADYDQTGLPRRVAPAATQVSVQIQALDSRSFLDRRDEIAQAIREAVLNAHGLNDVLGEL